MFIGNLPITSNSKSIYWIHAEPQAIENEFNVTVKHC